MIKSVIELFRREKIEEITVPDDFDSEFYSQFYPDLRHLDNQGAREHYIVAGYKEQRLINFKEAAKLSASGLSELPKDFSAEEYLLLNPDVAEHVGSKWEAMLHYLVFGRFENRRFKSFNPTIYDKGLLHTMTNHIYDMPEVVVDNSRSPSINVLVPAFEIPSMSAGFFGVFQTAKFIKTCGYKVRLVLFDVFNFDFELVREKLQNYPGLEDLFDILDVEYIGDRKKPLVISPRDNCVATVWYSAFFAEKIMKQTGGAEPFLYLIQDYESAFYAASSNYSFAERSYAMNYHALFSTSALMSHFERNCIGKSLSRRYAYFNNACSCLLPEREQFFSQKNQIATKRRLAFYCRPPVNRNMFELGALTLCEAVRSKVLDPSQWEFYGIGLGDAVIDLDTDVELKQLPRMNLKDYQNFISSFDLGLCLMASPHPSLLPFDLIGSGCSVVTNCFGVKGREYFDTVASGVFLGNPDVDSLVQAIKAAVSEIGDLNKRYQNALDMKFPRTWEESFDDTHKDFLAEAFKATPLVGVDDGAQ